MKIDPLRVKYLQLGSERGNLEESVIQQTGARIDTVATPFELIPEFRGIRLGAA
jgi:hypothetical protein